MRRPALVIGGLCIAMLASPSFAQISEDALRRAQAQVDGILASAKKIAIYCEWVAATELSLDAIRAGDQTALTAYNAKANAAFAKLGPTHREAHQTYGLSYWQGDQRAKPLHDAWARLDASCRPVTQ